MKFFYRFVFVLIALSAIAACGKQDSKVVDLGSPSGCDAANNRCVLTAKDMTVALSLGPNVHPLTPFKTVVTISGLEVDSASVIADFQMTGMDMGMNRYRLLKKESRWQGSVTLPVCTASRMDWVALIEFTSKGRQYRAHFPFHTTAN